MKNNVQTPDTHWVPVVHGWASFNLQLPLVHVCCPNVHRLLQIPQFELSVDKVTQFALQPLWPTAQQIPLVQLALAH